MDYQLEPIGIVHSSIIDRKNAPRQGYDGGVEAILELKLQVMDGLSGIQVGDEVMVLIWLHQAKRDVLQVRPGHDPERPITGVFATRSPDRPNPVGLHRVTVLKIEGLQLTVSPLEAINETPVIDIKPVLKRCHEE